VKNEKEKLITKVINDVSAIQEENNISTNIQKGRI
jgi:hypothetical protein